MAELSDDGQANDGHEAARGALAAGRPVIWLLRLEGLAVALLGMVLYQRTGASWWLFAGLLLVPDLSMLGYFAGPRWGARCYNTVHSYLLPVGLGCAALVAGRTAPIPFLLIWASHIGLDRLMGYGLKDARGFGWTHLSGPGRVGKQRI